MINEIVSDVKLREFLDKKHILFCHRPDQKRTQELRKIDFPSSLCIEPFIGVYSGHRLVSMKAFSYTNSVLPYDMSIGRYCSIGPGLKIMGFSHPVDRVSTSPFTYSSNNEFFKRALAQADYSSYIEPQVQKPVPKIENDVWIGNNVTLSRGITIHNGAIIAANSTVTKDVPPYAIVGGNPANVIKYRYNHRVISRALNFNWWDYHVKHIVASRSFELIEVMNYLENSEHKRYFPSHITSDHLLALDSYSV